MAGKAEIEIARLLFEEGWGGPDANAPLQYMTEDVVMRDILAHPEAMTGHQGVLDFFGAGAAHLKVMPEEYFVNERGVALTWVAYLAITTDHHGAENRGRWLCGEGMSRLETFCGAGLRSSTMRKGLRSSKVS